MPKKLLLKISIALTIPIACAQTFEVASIKPANPEQRAVAWRGGPGTNDPELLTVENFSLAGLACRAYAVPDYRLVAPNWMEDANFNVTARIPKGATKEQFLAMLRNLLSERFQMKVHLEKKQMPLYELSIAKGGPKFREAVIGPPRADEEKPRLAAPDKIETDRDGYPILGPGTSLALMAGHARMQSIHQPLSWLATQLSSQLGAPVHDTTALSGKYDFVVSWDPDGDNLGGPTLEQAVLEQLGLKLEKKKGPVDIVVVDSAEKIPTEN